MDRALREALSASEAGRAYLDKKQKAKRDRASRVKAKPKAPDSKTARRLERGIRLKVMRETVMARANERCELCGQSGRVLDLHHLISGPLRRVMESSDTCLGICADCHRVLHRGEVHALRRALEVAKEFGMGAAVSALGRRIDKVLEAQGTPVKLEVA